MLILLSASLTFTLLFYATPSAAIIPYGRQTISEADILRYFPYYEAPF